MTTARERIDLPRLRSRSWAVAMVATSLGVVGIGMWVWVTHPQDRVWLISSPLMLLILALGVFHTGYFVVAGPGLPAVLGERWMGVWERRVPFGPGTRVRIVGAGATVSVVVKSGEHGKAGVDVLAMTEYVRASRSVEVLRALADAAASPGVEGGKDVARQLRAQADYLASGADPNSSPLAAKRGPRLMGMRY